MPTTSIYFTNEQTSWLKARAKASDMSVSAYIRQALKPQDDKVDYDAWIDGLEKRIEQIEQRLNF